MKTIWLFFTRVHTIYVEALKTASFKSLIYKVLCFVFLLGSCVDNPEKSHAQTKERRHFKGEYVYRTQNETILQVPPPERKPLPAYPWEKNLQNGLRTITKEYFRCKGSSINVPRIVTQNNENQRYYDCGGSERHSLPLRNGKEFIYPILIDLLNHVQTKTGKRVIITCGHRCPMHNSYSDSSKESLMSKHMIGAEVDFYVQGLEHNPESIVQLLMDYYKFHSKYAGTKDYENFARYEKDTDVTTQPWFNKEVFIKLYKKKEGRDYDNRHPYPYISIQVRYDEELGERVQYSWEKANCNFLRY